MKKQHEPTTPNLKTRAKHLNIETHIYGKHYVFIKGG